MCDDSRDMLLLLPFKHSAARSKSGGDLYKLGALEIARTSEQFLFHLPVPFSAQDFGFFFITDFLEFGAVLLSESEESLGRSPGCWLCFRSSYAFSQAPFGWHRQARQGLPSCTLEVS